MLLPPSAVRLVGTLVISEEAIDACIAAAAAARPAPRPAWAPPPAARREWGDGGAGGAAAATRRRRRRRDEAAAAGHGAKCLGGETSTWRSWGRDNGVPDEWSAARPAPYVAGRPCLSLRPRPPPPGAWADPCAAAAKPARSAAAPW